MTRRVVRDRRFARPALGPRLGKLWQLFTEAQIVQWCGHDHHFLVVPDADGERAMLVPVWGEAA